MKFCLYQYSTEDAYCEKLLLICFKIYCYFYPYIYKYIYIYIYIYIYVYIYIYIIYIHIHIYIDFAMEKYLLSPTN